jgi:UDP-galactopyranose mutase
MLDSTNIDIELRINIKDVIKIENNKIYIDNKEYMGKLIYTGSVDELLSYKYGILPYRSVNFVFKEINKEHYQPVGVINYPTKEEEFTRITEYKHFTTNNYYSKRTIISKEYPCEYKKNENIPYYPIVNTKSNNIYNKYLKDLEKIDNLYLLGRLANYRYYNMDIVIENALKLYEKLKGV